MDTGDILVTAGLLNRDQLDQALSLQEETGGSLLHIVNKLRLASEEDVVKTLSQETGMDYELLTEFSPDPELMDLFPREILENNILLPLRKELGALTIGICEPLDIDILDQLRIIAAERVITVLIPFSQAREYLKMHFQKNGSSKDGKSKPKLKQPQRKHQSARETLSTLVHELEDEAKTHETTDNDFDKIETRELLLRLINVLEKKKIIERQDIC